MEVAVQDDAVLNYQRYFNRAYAYALIRNMSGSRVRFNAIWAASTRRRTS